MKSSGIVGGKLVFAGNPHPSELPKHSRRRQKQDPRRRHLGSGCAEGHALGTRHRIRGRAGLVPSCRQADGRDRIHGPLHPPARNASWGRPAHRRGVERGGPPVREATRYRPGHGRAQPGPARSLAGIGPRGLPASFNVLYCSSLAAAERSGELDAMLQKFSPQCILRSTTISTTNAISTAARFSNSTEPPLWSSGVNWRPKNP